MLLTELLSKSLNPQCCACGEAVLLIFSLQRGGGAFSLHRNVYTGTSPVKRSHRLTFLRNLEKKVFIKKKVIWGCQILLSSAIACTSWLRETPRFCGNRNIYYFRKKKKTSMAFKLSLAMYDKLKL